MREKILETLDRKQKEYRKINEWFETKMIYCTLDDKMAEYEKNAIVCHAQIQVLLFLLSDDTAEV